MELPLRLLPRSELRQTHDMARTLITNRPKRRGRQVSLASQKKRSVVELSAQALQSGAMLGISVGDLSAFCSGGSTTKQNITDNTSTSIT